jgi:hypothetical protein
MKHGIGWIHPAYERHFETVLLFTYTTFILWYWLIVGVTLRNEFIRSPETSNIKKG